jgi:hypothetical protein
MSNEVNAVETVPASTRKASKRSSTAVKSKRSSTAVKLVQAAALAAVLVPLGTVSVETTTCGFGSYYTNHADSGCNFSSSSPTHEEFDFAGHNYFFDLTLTLLNPNDGFFVTINDNVMNQATFQPRLAPEFADYECVPLVDPTSNANPCRDFVVDVGGGQFTHYNFTIDWNYDSEHNQNNLFADMGGRVRVVHNRGSGVNHNTFDQDMCLTFGCTYNPDPDIGSGDTDFDSVAVAFDRDGAGELRAVPEPTTLILLGSGLGGILYRRRRRKP